LNLHSKLRRKAHVAFTHVVHIGYSITEHQRAFHTHAESKTGIHIRIDASGPQHLRLYHHATAPFNPLRAAFSVRIPYVKLSRWFRKGEEVWTKPDGSIGTKHGGRKIF